MVAPVLVLACGNPSRGDDAVGPLVAEAVERSCGDAIARGELEVLADFQLAVEHALDVAGRSRVYFVDAAASGPEVTLNPLLPRRDDSFTTHRLSPSALLQVCCDLDPSPLPQCRLLAIRGERFELGAPLSPRARANLQRALLLLATDLGAPADSARHPQAALDLRR